MVSKRRRQRKLPTLPQESSLSNDRSQPEVTPTEPRNHEMYAEETPSNFLTPHPDIYPEIVIEEAPKLKKLLRAIKKKLGRAVNSSAHGNGIRIFPADENEYEVVYAYLSGLKEEDGVIWYSKNIQEETREEKEEGFSGITKNFPLIVVERIPDLMKHESLWLKNSKIYGSGLCFKPKNEIEYRTIYSYLSSLKEEDGVTWFSYSPRSERSLKFAIRGLPADSELIDIEEDLRRLGFEPEIVRKVDVRKNRPCIFFIQLKPTALTKDLSRITELGSKTGIVFEVWKGRKGPAQCHRCQGFRHSSHNCYRELACVRCGGPHYAFQCPRPIKEQPTCANCDGAHTANSNRCPKFLKEVRNKKAGTLAANSVIRKRDVLRLKQDEVVESAVGLAVEDGHYE